MTRCASPLTLAATMGLAAGLTAYVSLSLVAAGHADPIQATPALTRLSQVSVRATPASVIDREGRQVLQQAAMQDAPVRVARVINPSHDSTVR
ncbi:hypothetical protein [Methylobacterium iners]|uniref:SAF domain-containing protein n=1 Tax=Methylobacterium iners TaxID=418707 RepID=A0ABQ4RS28_9HYPH|nr:hypothetical protein [Methylobacterium iners]GJD93586.1 hypothetical protein OCOJLMKI_0782 [Methylobacterium iners]